MNNSPKDAPGKNAKVIRELLIISIIAIVSYLLSSFFGAFDNVIEFVEQNEAHNEFMLLPIILSVALFIFAMRRWREAERQLAERKRAEEVLKESEEKFRSLAEQMPNMIYINKRGRVVYANVRCEEIMGYKREELYSPGFDFLTLIAPESTDLIKATFSNHMKGEEVAPYEYTIITKEGERIEVIGTTRLITYEGESAISGVLTDITERKSLERQLGQTLVELTRSNAELEQFAYVASHDLNEPLRTVSSYLQLVERRYKDKLDSDAREFINYAVEGADRMRSLISDLLTYSRVGTRGRPFQMTDSKQALDQAVTSIQLAVKESSAEITHSTLPTVLADPSQLIQLFQNLICNAIKFRSDQPPRVHVSGEKIENEWVFSIRDNGIGIAPEYFERVFKVFQRLHSRGEYPGTGIGLAVCKKIVERHGGRIWVESEPGKGAEFHFTIPAKGR